MGGGSNGNVHSQKVGKVSAGGKENTRRLGKGGQSYGEDGSAWSVRAPGGKNA